MASIVTGRMGPPVAHRSRTEARPAHLPEGVRAVGARIGKWAGFSVGLALLPIVFNLLYALTFEPDLTRAYLLGRGELLLPAVGLSAAALGDLIIADRRSSTFKVLAAVGCVVIIACASFYFASVSSRYATPDRPDTNVVFWVSIFFYGLAVLSSASSLYISEQEREDEFT